MFIIGGLMVVGGLVLTVLGGGDLALSGPGRMGVGLCAMLAGIEPRRNRPLALPLFIALVAGAVVSLIEGLPRSHIIADGGLAITVLVLMETARSSVNGSLFRGGPPLA
ncbi:MAG: hypothetical protein ACI8RZ_005030 [Myxococcota bacterium]|jgi:hypothetical protein